MIKNYVGNLLKDNAGIIAHQTNCVGVMGAGIALQIKKQLLPPAEYAKYTELCRCYKEQLLGNIQYLKSRNRDQWICNVFGENVPTGYRLDTDYKALESGLRKLEEDAARYGFSVAIPGLMGCGLAGGDWKYVLEHIIKPIFLNSSVEFRIVYLRPEDFKKYN